MYTVLIKETEEIMECPSLKVLYYAVRRRLRYETYDDGTPCLKLTCLFYKDLTGFEFSKTMPFFKMEN
jgi:hypothetical protein